MFLDLENYDWYQIEKKLCYEKIIDELIYLKNLNLDNDDMIYQEIKKIFEKYEIDSFIFLEYFSDVNDIDSIIDQLLELYYEYNQVSNINPYQWYINNNFI